MSRLSEKDTLEIVPVTFEFGTSTLANIVIEVMVSAGGDDVATAAMVIGSPQIYGSSVIQLIGGGIDGNDYLLRCRIDSGSERYINSAILPIRKRKS